MKIAIIGLGYVGHPLAISLSNNYEVIGYDISQTRIDFLKSNEEKLNISYTNTEADIKKSDVYIVTVPTPVNDNNLPDMSPLENASTLIGKYLSKSSIVIYESTVYPGATEEFCVPILESISGLLLNNDFSVAYSPERIDPGNKVNTLENTIKLISASNADALEVVREIYESVVTEASLHTCDSIKICEAAKAVENIQRDVNIALMNELSIIFNKLDIPTRSVIEAASTKWNFGKYHPGLVGGHCIGVDPYYVIYKAEKVGIDAKLIKGSREINDGMVDYTLNKIREDLDNYASRTNLKNPKILFLGLTFKENCGDIRNSQPRKLAEKLFKLNPSMDIYDPWVTDQHLGNLYLLMQEPKSLDYDVIIKAVNHNEFINSSKISKDSKNLFIDLTNSLTSDGFSLY